MDVRHRCTAVRRCGHDATDGKTPPADPRPRTITAARGDDEGGDLALSARLHPIRNMRCRIPCSTPRMCWISPAIEQPFVTYRARFDAARACGWAGV